MNKPLLWRSPSFRNVTTLVSGTAVAQVINLFSTPLLTRIYSPDEYAVFQLFYSLATSLAVLATLRYELAIVNPDNEEETNDLITICFYSTLVISVLSLLLVIGWHASLVQLGPFDYWYYLIPVYVFFAGLVQTMNYLSTRLGTFRRNMFGRIATSISTALVAIGAGYAGLRPAGLLISAGIGQLTGFMVLYRSMSGLMVRPFRPGNTVKETLRKYKKYPLFNGPHALLDVVQDNAIIFLIGAYFQFSMVAFFGQAMRILKAPFNFIGTAIFQVIYPKFNEFANEGKDLRPYLMRFYVQLGLIGFPFFAALFFYGAPTFSWLLGSEWEEAGRIASILSPWLYLNFLSSPFSCMALIRNRQDIAMGFTVLNAVLRTGAVIAGGLLQDATMALAMMSVAGTFVFIALLTWYYSLGAPSYGIGDYQRRT